jgi:AcrR family transcriptional regulator
MKKRELRLERERWRRQEYHREILAAAEKVIARRGYSAVTMDDVAREAEFSKATLYNYFSGKGELILEIIESFFDEISRALTGITGLDASATQKLKLGIQFYLQFNQEKENISRVLMLDRAFIEKLRIIVSGEKKLASEIDKKFIGRIRAKRSEILAAGATILRQGVENGEFRNIDVPSTMAFLEALLQGYCHVKFWHEKQYSVAEATDLIHGLFLRGIENQRERAKGEYR